MSLKNETADFAYYKLNHITGIQHNSIEHAVIESNETLQDVLNKQKWVIQTHRNRSNNILLALNF